MPGSADGSAKKGFLSTFFGKQEAPTILTSAQFGQRAKLLESKEQKLAELEVSLRERESNLVRLEQEISKRSKTATTVDSDTQRAIQELERRQQEIERLKNTEKAITEFIEAKKKSLGAIEKTARQRTNTISSQEKELSGRTHDLNRATEQLGKLKNSFQERQRSITEKEFEIHKREQSLQTNEKQLSSATVAFESKKKQLERDVESLTKKRAVLSQESASLQTVVSQLKTEAKSKAAYVDLANAKKQELSTLTSQITASKQAIIAGKKGIQDLQLDIDRNASKAEATRKELEDLLFSRDTLAQNLSVLEQTKQKISKEATAYQKLIHSISRKQTNLEEREKQIKEAQKLLVEKDKLLFTKQQSIDTKEKTITVQEQELVNFKAELDQKKSALLAVEGAIANRQAELSAILKESERQKKFKELLSQKEKKLLNLEQELTGLARTIDVRRKDLDTREVGFNQQRSEWTKKQDIIQKNLDDLSITKSQLQEDIRLAKLQVEAVMKELDIRMNTLDAAKNELRSHISNIKKIQETDIALLEDKEEELVKTVKKIEADRRKLADQEDSLINRLNEFEDEESKLTNREESLEKREVGLRTRDTQIRATEEQLRTQADAQAKDRASIEALKQRLDKAKELKKEIPQLEKKWQELHIHIREAEAKLMRYGLEPLAKREYLKNIEGAVKSRQKDLQFQQDILSSRELELVEEAQHLRQSQDEALHEYMERETKAPYSLDVPRPAETKYPKLYHLLEQAREALKGGRIQDAIRYAVQLETLSESLSTPERRSVMLDVMSLKTDIKLASLA